MKSLQQVFNNQRLRSESSWRLLALEHAPVALGLLQVHLLDKDKRLSHSILLERLKQDLEQLRAQGLELPQPAESYLANWLRSGFLVRDFPAGAVEEEYSLSLAATRAIQFIQGLEERRMVTTESRLSLVLNQLHDIAEQTEPDATVRLRALLRERGRLDAEIERVRAGDLEPMADERAIERTREVIALARELTGDFRSVQDEFQRLNRNLREQIVENEGSRGEVLEQVFSGVDLIAESDAGRTFKAFWRLLTDPEQSLGLEAALDQVLSRDFARRLDRSERRFLVQMTRLLLDNGGDVHEAIQHFARGLKQFVQSRAFREQRQLNRLLGQAQRDARAATEAFRPLADIGLELELSSARLRSLAQWELYDPSRDHLESGIERAPDAEISLEAVSELLVQSEIDFRRLREQVEELLTKRPQVTIGDVLGHYPAEQGLGSVVGLLALGAKEGVRSQDSERVCWQGLDATERCARIPRIYFIRSEANARAG